MAEHQLDVADRGAEGAGIGQAVYTRPMPGGGHVRVELLVSDPAEVAGERRRGRLVVDAGALLAPSPIVLEEVEGDDQEAVVDVLFRVACDNAAIARRVLRWQASRAD